MTENQINKACLDVEDKVTSACKPYLQMNDSKLHINIVATLSELTSALIKTFDDETRRTLISYLVDMLNSDTCYLEEEEEDSVKLH